MRIFYAVTAVVLALNLNAQSLNVKWQKCLGGPGSENSALVVPRSDESYTIGFTTTSTNGVFSGNKGLIDWYFTKYEKDETVSVNRILGGSMTEELSNLNENTDKTYLAIGTTNSSDGNISGYKGGGDCWMTKLVSNCNIQWRKCIGGTKADTGKYAIQDSNGKYLIIGSTESNDGDFSSNAGGSDFFFIRTDLNGIFELTKTFGGSGNDVPVSIIQVSDGYIIIGNSTSTTLSGSNNNGASDILVIKVDNSGTQQWTKFYGGSNDDFAISAILTADNNILISGTSNSSNGDLTGNKGGSDFWLLKIFNSGNIQWSKNYGGSGNETGGRVVEMKNVNNYFMIGTTNSNNGDISSPKGGKDVFVIRTNSTGSLVTSKTFGGSSDDEGYTINLTASNDLLCSGKTSSNNIDVSGNNGAEDAWIFLLANPTSTNEITSNHSIKIGPNPASSFINIDNTDFDISEIQLFDLQGRLLKGWNINSGNDKINLGLPELVNGSYYLLITKGNKSFSQALTILR